MGYSPRFGKESDMTEWLTLSLSYGICVLGHSYMCLCVYMYVLLLSLTLPLMLWTSSFTWRMLLPSSLITLRRINVISVYFSLTLVIYSKVPSPVHHPLPSPVFQLLIPESRHLLA